MAKIHIIISLKITEKFLILTLTTQLHQKIRFSEIFFRILNMFAIVSNLQKNNLIFVKTHKNNFLDPQTTNLNKTRRGHFWSSWPQKNPLNWQFPTKWYPCLDISLFCYSLA